MTRGRRNRLSIAASFGQHHYQVQFQCDSEAVRTTIATYDAAGAGAKIPWVVAKSPFGCLGGRTRNSDSSGRPTCQRPLGQAPDFKQICGRADFERAISPDLSLPTDATDAAIEAQRHQRTFEAYRRLLKGSVLNIADVFPDEVVEGTCCLRERIKSTDSLPSPGQFCLPHRHHPPRRQVPLSGRLPRGCPSDQLSNRHEPSLPSSGGRLTEFWRYLPLAQAPTRCDERRDDKRLPRDDAVIGNNNLRVENGAGSGW